MQPKRGTAQSSRGLVPEPTRLQRRVGNRIDPDQPRVGFHTLVGFDSCLHRKPRHGAHMRASRSSPLIYGLNSRCRPSGLCGSRKSISDDISTSTIPTTTRNLPIALSNGNQGLRVAMHSACWGKSASKCCTAGSASGSPQTQHRSEYRSLGVMRNAHTA